MLPLLPAGGKPSTPLTVDLGKEAPSLCELVLLVQQLCMEGISGDYGFHVAFVHISQVPPVGGKKEWNGVSGGHALAMG